MTRLLWVVLLGLLIAAGCSNSQTQERMQPVPPPADGPLKGKMPPAPRYPS